MYVETQGPVDTRLRVGSDEFHCEIGRLVSGARLRWTRVETEGNTGDRGGSCLADVLDRFSRITLGHP